MKTTVEVIKRRNIACPRENDIESNYTYKKMWEEGWFDDYDDKHFFIRALYGDETIIRNVRKYCRNVTEYEKEYNVNFCDTFLINLLFRINNMIEIFGEEKIKKFVSDQLAAGKKHYKEAMFFEALTEIEIITFFANFGPELFCAEYEPQTGNGRKNPEASFLYKNGLKIYVEVKTPEFSETNGENVCTPLRLLSVDGIKKYESLCKKYGYIFIRPRVSKLKTFLESACNKFHIPDENEYNILCINWTYTDVKLFGYIEPTMLLYNEYNGILNHRDIAKKVNISEEIYTKITAILVFQNSLEGLEMCNLQYLWAGYPRHAALLINPYLLDTEEKLQRFHDSIQIRMRDFAVEYDMEMYFDLDKEMHIYRKKLFKEIIEDNIL